MFHLPETMKSWPWPRQINPHYKEVAAESTIWLKSYKPFSEEAQNAFDRGNFEHLRIGSLLFVVDEYTEGQPEHVVRELVDIFRDALNNPTDPRPNGENILGEMTRDFWQRVLKTATPESAQHFMESCNDYLESIVAQAADCDSDTVRTIDTFVLNRRENSGVRPSFLPGELHLSIPDHAFHHPTIRELQHLVVDIVTVDNDLASYNKEQAVGDDRSNILTVTMRQYQLPLAEAAEWVAKYHAELEAKFHDTLTKVPSWGKEVDDHMAEYIEHLINWPRGNDCWNFEGGRYFGSKGEEIQRTRVVQLLPQRRNSRGVDVEKVVPLNLDAL
ncbi:terpenoid synthase [Trametopsis cervina]|nr:terpenoid synthase [Trametopsis cervina]